MSLNDGMLKKHKEIFDKIKVIKDETDPDYMQYNSLSLFLAIISTTLFIASILECVTNKMSILPVTAVLFVVTVIFGWFIRTKRMSHKLLRVIVYALEVALTIFGVAIYVVTGGVHSSAAIWFILVLTLTVITLNDEIRVKFFATQLLIFVTVVLLDFAGIINVTTSEHTEKLHISVVSALICVSVAVGIYIKFIQSEFKHQQERLRDEIKAVTEKKEQAEKLMAEYEKTTKVATRALKVQEEFLSNMSHEIKTPLNAVIGLSEVIDKSNNIDEIHNLSKSIMGASRGLDCVIGNIIEYAAKGDVDVKINNNPYSIEGVFHSVKNMSAQRLESKGVGLIVERGAVPNMLIGDIIRVQNVIFNIINVSVKNTEAGRVVFKCDYDYEHQLLKFSITDTSTGISDEEIRNIIEWDSENNESDFRPTNGTDIGLTICKRIVDVMNGTIYVRNTESGGIEFSVTLPQKVFEPGKDAPAGQPGAGKGGPDFHGKKIMYIDATKVNHLLIDSILLDTGAFIGHEFNPKGVLSNPADKLKEFDIIIMDPVLPSMDGEQLLVHLRSRGVKAPIVCACQNLTIDTRKAYLEKGFSECIQKPIVALQLLGLCVGIFSGLKGPGDR